jgi:Raf kinase inhibitor-like YbhB/YbcL family protein
MNLGQLLYRFRGHDRHLAWNRLVPAPQTLIVSSPAFADGAPIPRRHAGTGVGDDIAPPLAVAGLPPETAELVLILQDPDAPLPRPAVHMIARLPAAPAVAEGMPGILGLGRGSFGSLGYHGPRPVPGHGPHRYVFQLFAVDRTMAVADGTRLGTWLAAMTGHVLARGKLTGTFERKA